MKPYDYLLYATVVFGWSTSWLALKNQLGIVAPEVSLVWRFGAAACLMFVIVAARRQQLRFALRQHLSFAALGICLFSSNFTLFYYGGQHGASGLMAVVFSAASLINVLMLAVISRTAPRPIHLMAAIVGIVGVGVLYWPELRGSEAALISVLLCLGGTLFFCTGNMVSADAQRNGIPVMGATAWGMLYGTIFMIIISLIRGHAFIIEHNITYVGSLIWLVVISSVLTFYSYLTLLGRIGAARTGYATVVFPVFALLISTAFEDYRWSLYALVGLSLVMAGNVLMVRSRS